MPDDIRDLFFDLPTGTGALASEAAVFYETTKIPFEQEQIM